VCNACQRAKSHQLPYSKSSSSSSHPLELIYSDVWGYAPKSVGGKQYYMSFIDDYSKFSWIYPLKFKYEVFFKFVGFQKLVEHLFDRKIISVQTDWGDEYQKLHGLFSKIGITHHVSRPYAHQQNGSAEQKHHHIVEVALSLLAHASMPLKYWDDAFLTGVYLINRLPRKVLGYETPLECLFKQTLDYKSLRVFGYAYWPNLHRYNNQKLLFCSQRCVFLGFSTFHKGFKCLDPKLGCVYISRDVTFDETIFPFFELHPNAARRLQEEINLLPSHLLNPRVIQLCDHVSNNSNLAANPGVSTGNQEHVHVANTEETNLQEAVYVANDDDDLGMDIEVDLPAPNHAGVAPPGSLPPDAASAPNSVPSGAKSTLNLAPTLSALPGFSAARGAHPPEHVSATGSVVAGPVIADESSTP
jgi:hypothetical protein